MLGSRLHVGPAEEGRWHREGGRRPFTLGGQLQEMEGPEAGNERVVSPALH